MSNYRKWVHRTLMLILALLLGIMISNFVVDPFQHFRKASFYRTYFKEERYLNPGIAKTFEYDTVIVGSSMIQNFRPSAVDSILNTVSVKLPIPGSSAYEQSLTLDTALRTGKVRRVLFGLDLFSFKGAPKRLSGGEGSIPFYLYDDDPFNDLKYLLSLDTLIFYKYIIRSTLAGRDARKLEMDNYGYWGDRFDFGSVQVLEDWKTGNFNKNAVTADFSVKVLKESFDANFLDHFRANPEVRFDLFFPPYSVLVWLDCREKGLLDDFLLFKQYVVSAVANLDNVQVFDFQAEEKIIADLGNYKDVSHYSPAINELMTRAIAENEYRVDPRSIEAINDRLRALIADASIRYLH
ncbi:hypothetical protein [Trichloromonas sp.]|uniref:hypothetical protein n=1 Tax=Trichloromonas sp. TaxID=3069249 RepID=UPI003D815F93